MGAGSTNLKEYIMANIGTFIKTGNEYKGEIVTMSVQQKNVRIVPETSDNENAPSHRVFVGRAEIGAAWTKTSNEGREYLSVKLDDPSFTQPIVANLFDDEGGETGGVEDAPGDDEGHLAALDGCDEEEHERPDPRPVPGGDEPRGGDLLGAGADVGEGAERVVGGDGGLVHGSSCASTFLRGK